MQKLMKSLVIWAIVFAVAVGSVGLLQLWQEKQELAVIKAMSWAVAGRRFVIDPGHGGEDPGKMSPTGVMEKDINLAIAKKLSAVISAGGGQVKLTRDSDVALSDNEGTIRERKTADLKNRAKMAQNDAADIYLSVHCNAFPESRWSGAQTFYSPAVNGSKELAICIQEELTLHLGNTKRKALPDTSSLIFKEAKIPIVNVEVGFLSNEREEKMLQDSAYQDKICWAIYAGIVRFLADYGEDYSPVVKKVGK